MKRLRWLILILALIVIAGLLSRPGRHVVSWLVHRFGLRYSVEQRLKQYGPAARARLRPGFAHAGVRYPPKKLVLLGLKQERELQVYAAGKDGNWRFVRSYPILAASGNLGPKLRYGDCQVPEGMYRVEFLNPNSDYHLSLRLNYPNDFDRAMAKRDGRTQLGGDIMIHGSDVSVGCLAMGDEASEDLFVLGYDTGLRNIEVILSPVDFRQRKLPREMPEAPEWAGGLYDLMGRKLRAFPAERQEE